MLLFRSEMVTNLIVAAIESGFGLSDVASDFGSFESILCYAYNQYLIRICLMSIWVQHEEHIGTSSLVIRKLWVFLIWPILSRMMMTSDFLDNSIGKGQWFMFFLISCNFVIAIVVHLFLLILICRFERWF